MAILKYEIDNTNDFYNKETEDFNDFIWKSLIIFQLIK